jgi:acetyl esterase/lipase
MKTIIGIALFLMISGAAFAKETILPDKKLVYKSIDHTELALHVFNPKAHKLTDKRPAIVFFFGGGWSGGTPKQFYQQARASLRLDLWLCRLNTG